MPNNGNIAAGTTGNTDTGDTTENMEITTPVTSPTKHTSTTPGSGVKRSLAERKKEDFEGLKGLETKKEIMESAISPPNEGRQKVIHNHTNVTTHSIGDNNIIHGSIVNAPVNASQGAAEGSPASYTTADLYDAERPTEQMEIDTTSTIISSMTNTEERHVKFQPQVEKITIEGPDGKTTAATSLFQAVLEKQRARLDNIPDTPTKGQSYATAISSPLKQPTITEPVIVHRKHSFRLMWAFHSKHPKKQYIVARRRKGEILQTAIKDLLKAGTEITEDFALNTWDPSIKANTLQNTGDVPADYNTLQKYLKPPEKGGIRQGETNNNWGIHVTCGVPMQHFLGYWAEMKPYKRVDRIRSVYQPIRAAPLQDKEWHEIGWLVGATNKQYMDENVEHFQNQFPDVKIGFNWQGINFNRVQEHWKHAERTFRTNRDTAEKAKLSPTSYQILINKEEHIGKVMKYMYNHHGKLGENGTWPSMPDGSKLRFTPNFKYLKDQKGRHAINRRMALHIQMKWTNHTIQSSIKNPGAKLECLKGKSIGHAILEHEMEVDGQKEPYFRHFTKVWNRDPTIERWEICVHQHMYQAAKANYINIVKELAVKHGNEIYEAFHDGPECTNETEQTQSEEERITFDLDDDDDMYMSGKGNFIFQGIPDIQDTQSKELAKLKQMQDDAATSVGFSANENQKELQPEETPDSGWTTVTRNNRNNRNGQSNTSNTHPPGDHTEGER